MNTLRFRIVFALCWWVWTYVYAFVLHWYGFKWMVALADSVVSNVLLAAASFLVFTILQYYMPGRSRFRYIGALCSVFTFLWIVLCRIILSIILSDAPSYSRFLVFSIPIRVAFCVLTLGCVALSSVLWYSLQEQQDIDKRKTEAEKLSKEAELFKLRQQLQPHFLFNSLNSINALIGLQPERARTMIQHLSDFLRGTLRKEENEWLSITEELEHLQLYLEIEKVRFGHRLHFVIDNGLPAGPWLIPSMLLQPIVENAIKFGLYGTTGEITIYVNASAEENALRLEVRNPFDPEAHLTRGTGFGLSSVRRRLFLIFARHDLVETTSDQEFFTTTIKIPQRDDTRHYY